jgi:hypothetical protein
MSRRANVVRKKKVRFVSGDTECAAWHYPGTNGGCVIRAGGFAVTKEPGTDLFARRFNGFSASGGHIFRVAARNPQLAAAIAQTPNADGPASARNAARHQKPLRADRYPDWQQEVAARSALHGSGRR